MVGRALVREGFDVTGRATGGDVCEAIRSRGVHSPVLFLTARDAVSDRIAGFGAGGDDYVMKPFEVKELVARLRALLRRSAPDATVEAGGLRLDPIAQTVQSGDMRITL